MALAVGFRLGVFEVTGALGAGGMGEVYLARDTSLKRDVALKILPATLAADADRVARFQREAELLATLSHPHIAAIHGLVEADGVRALVLELVGGETLADRVARGPLPVDDVLVLARQLAEALDYAHEHSVVHRDLKPANLKVTPDGALKVLDFGLAKALEGPNPFSVEAAHSPTLTSPAMTQAGMLLGTAAYMSPEQARGKPVDKRADIWAFGCVLYELLTGARAFEGETVSDTLASVLKSEPDWARLPAATPPALVALLKRCLTRDPRQRLRDIGDAARDLAEGGQTATPGPAAEPTRHPTSFWLPWGVAAVLALALAATLGLGTRTDSRQPRAESSGSASASASMRISTPRSAPPRCSRPMAARWHSQPRPSASPARSSTCVAWISSMRRRCRTRTAHGRRSSPRTAPGSPSSRTTN
jgi:serine/threonine protein kinase